MPIYPCADNARCSAWRARRLSQAATGQRQRPRGKAAHRRAVHRATVLRGATDRPHAERGGLSDRPQARAQADAVDGDRGARAEAANDQARSGTQDLSLPAARSGDRAAEPGLGGRHHLYPDRPRLPLPGRRHRLGEPGGARLAAVQHHGRLVLRGGVGGGAGRLWRTGHLQHRPRQPVHQRGFHRRADRGWRAHLDGRARPSAWTTCSSNASGARSNTRTSI